MRTSTVLLFSSSAFAFGDIGSLVPLILGVVTAIVALIKWFKESKKP